MADTAPTERLFLAVAPSPAQREAVTELQATLRRDPGLARALRWSPPEQMHLTLAFLGDVPRHHRDAIVRAATFAASRTAPFAWRPARLDGFPSARRARVAWLGIEKGNAETIALRRTVVAALADEGVPQGDARAFTPHLTIARTRRGRAVTLPETGASTPRAMAGHLRLIRSVPAAGGARHDLLARLPFGASPGTVGSAPP